MGNHLKLKRCAKHFKEALNRSASPISQDIPPPTKLLLINSKTPSKTEIAQAIKSLKSAGPDGIPPESLKADNQTSK